MRHLKEMKTQEHSWVKYLNGQQMEKLLCASLRRINTSGLMFKQVC